MTALSKLVKTTTFRWSLAYVMLFVIGAAVVLGLLFWRTNDLITSQVRQTIAAEVKGLREQYRTGGMALLARTVNERARTEGNAVYLLTDRHGRKIAGNLRAMPSEVQNRPSRAIFTYQDGVQPGSRERLAVGVPIAVAGGALLLVGRDIEDQRDFINMTRRILVWGVSFVVFIGLGTGFLISRQILKRIDAVTAASQTIMSGDLSGRIPLNGSGDELDRLSEGLNAMLERIEQLMTGMREVSDNIAHDLKTPLTRMRNRTEAALRDPRGKTAYREALESTLEESDDLIRTFNALLSIARLEAGAAGNNMTQVDLAIIVGDVVELYEPAVEEAGLAIALDVEDGTFIRCERQLIGQALANLIDNAIKYGASEHSAHSTRGSDTPPPSGVGDVLVSVRRRQDSVELVVGDGGPGIPREDRERVLKRFVRLEESRSRPGSGLGLSLVAAVAKLHGGDVRLEDNHPGLRVVVTLPLAQVVTKPPERRLTKDGLTASDEESRERRTRSNPSSLASEKFASANS